MRGEAKVPAAVVGAPSQEVMGARTARGDDFEQRILDGSFQLVRGRYFTQRLEEGRPFQKQQDIPAEHVWPGAEAVRHWKKWGPAFLVIVSYCWLSPGHPDPDMFHLRRFCRLIRAQIDVVTKKLKISGSEGFPGDLALIVDFCALPQKERDGTDLRSAEQHRRFGDALKEINTAYAHNHVMCWRFQHVPPAEPRTYDDRGWTLFERVITDCRSQSSVELSPLFDIQTLVVLRNDVESMDQHAFNRFAFRGLFGLRAGRRGRGARGPPLTPARFNAELEQRHARMEARGLRLFTNGKDDHDFVKAKYKDFYRSRFEGVTELDFCHRGWGPEDALHLAEVLEDCKALRFINLLGNPITDRGMRALLPHIGARDLSLVVAGDNFLGPSVHWQLLEATLFRKAPICCCCIGCCPCCCHPHCGYRNFCLNGSYVCRVVDTDCQRHEIAEVHCC